jgi:hypothetical protein
MLRLSVRTCDGCTRPSRRAERPEGEHESTEQTAVCRSSNRRVVIHHTHLVFAHPYSSKPRASAAAMS